MSWAMSFALGAIVSPTDPVAATALMRRVGAPRRGRQHHRGRRPDQRRVGWSSTGPRWPRPSEGFSLVGASLEFVGAVIGGIAIGLVVAS